MTIAEYTLQNGGGTFDNALRPVQLSTGYVVGGIMRPVILNNVSDLDDLKPFMTNEFFGTWIAPDGRIYIDAVQVVSDRQQAIELAKQRGELAIWDAENKVEVTIS